MSRARNGQTHNTWLPRDANARIKNEAFLWTWKIKMKKQETPF